jgi:uncharacterized HAD superfamily protein
MVVIIDIDGTICNAKRRFEKAGPEPIRDNVEAYNHWVKTVNEGCEHDEPVPGMSEICWAMKYSISRVVYLTSRTESLRKKTEEWLSNHNFPDLKVKMRPEDNFQETWKFKLEAIKRLRRHAKEQVLVIDDDEHGTIENMCKLNGFTFLKARSGGQK